MQVEMFETQKTYQRSELRDYQAEAKEAAETLLRTQRSTLVVMATGLGKTVLLSAIARDFVGRVLVLAHRDELIRQLCDSLSAMAGEHVGVEKAEQRGGRARIVVASVQTICREYRRKYHEKFDLIIIDECHRSAAKSYTSIIKAYPEAKVLGVTATPDRGDRRSLGKVFESVAYEMDIIAGVEAGYLVPLAGTRVEVDGIDLDSVPTQNGDLAQGALDAEMLKGAAVIAHRTLEICQGQTIIFAPGVRSAHAIAGYLNELKPGCAAAVDGKTDYEERQAIMADYKSCRVQFLCNCQVATEGFDAPDTAYIVMARPTKSRSLYAQMAGRGTRPLPGIVDGLDTAEERRASIAGSQKPSAAIVDFVGNGTRHSLMCPVDLFADGYTKEEVARAKKISKRSPMEPREALKVAREEIKRIEEAKLVRARVMSFDPFKVGGVHQGATLVSKTPASDKQRSALVKFGVDPKEAERMSKAEAKKFLDAAFVRKSKGLATYKQLKVLSRFGHDNPNISFERASQMLSQLAANGWRK